LDADGFDITLMLRFSPDPKVANEIARRNVQIYGDRLRRPSMQPPGARGSGVVTQPMPEEGLIAP
jgi:hypothetical protein